jgi:glucose-6-phosphate 1-epimerase
MSWASPHPFSPIHCSNMGPLTNHGFVRTTAWTLLEVDGPKATLRFSSNKKTYSLWPFHFHLDYHIVIEYVNDTPHLNTDLIFYNLGDSTSVEFTIALHPYFSVDNISEVRLQGLKSDDVLSYLDNTQNRKSVIETNKTITIHDKVDRIYLQCGEQAIIENVSNESVSNESVSNESVSIVIQTPKSNGQGFGDKVVWNPSATSHQNYKRFLCVEAAQIVPKVCVPPLGVWKGTMRVFFQRERERERRIS